SGLAAARPESFHIAAGPQTEKVEGEVVSGNYFQVLGIGAALGRTITPDDDKLAGGHPVVVLDHRYWQSKFQGDPGVLGKEILINGRNFRIIGVTPAEFFGAFVGRASDIRVPMAMLRTVLPWWTNGDDEFRNYFTILGRLKPGISLSQA